MMGFRMILAASARATGSGGGGGGSSAYRDAVLADSPAAYWRLGEASGTIASDETANNLDGTYSGNVTLGEPSLLASDADTSVHVQSSGHMLGPTINTVQAIEAWANLDNTSSFHSLFDCYKDTNNRIFLRYMGSSTQRFDLAVGGSSVILSDDAAVAGQTYHIAVYYDSGSNTTYMVINGVVQADTYVGNPWPSTGYQVRLGVRHYAGSNYEPLTGHLDEAAIYSTTPTLARFQDHYNTGIGA